MVEIEKQEVKLKTEKQEALIAKLIQSSQIVKAERDFIVDKIAGKLITTKDAGILAAYLIAKIQFNKHFNDRRKHKIAQCFNCKNKVSVKRYELIETGKRQWFCSVCYLQNYKGAWIEVKKSKAVDVDRIDEGHIRAVVNGPALSGREKLARKLDVERIADDFVHEGFIKPEDKERFIRNSIEKRNKLSSKEQDYLDEAYDRKKDDEYTESSEEKEIYDDAKAEFAETRALEDRE